jgi:hypothetical protein
LWCCDTEGKHKTKISKKSYLGVGNELHMGLVIERLEEVLGETMETAHAGSVCV